uniref:Prenyl transferase n=1 Tax=Helminthora furcellata TaxID=1884666 RepID=A0A1G4NR74_9FLOR|nr:Prenyl transferase [Helminthora furcellata]SCW21158.1 Prenyl transferase [Helminthora furcellata]SCW24018.1 Prenyl transferase [Helminthora furcellata]
MKTQQIFAVVEDDLKTLDENLKSMVGARHPILSAASEHLFSAGGKRLRPALVILVARHTLQKTSVTPSHLRLAEITEIIHTASLVHDDVIDECITRRGVTTVHSLYNNKIAILAGDFLFAQSSWYLANLDNLDVVKTISKVITDFAEGEVRQGMIQFNYQISMNEYIEKSFYKTASLMAASCQGSAMLSNLNHSSQHQYYIYGKHLGLAFQIIDDMLDIIGSNKNLGKPVGSDLKNGNLTAPVLFTLLETSDLQYLIEDEFENDSDVKNAVQLIYNGQGLKKAKDLAEEHIQTAINVIPDQGSEDNQDSLYSLIMLGEYILQQIS